MSIHPSAAATMVGQNLGAKQPERAERAVWTAARYNMINIGIFWLFEIPLAWVLATRTHSVRGEYSGR